MRKWIFYFALISFIPLKGFSQPTAELDKTSIEYGKINFGGPNLISEFRLKNTGNEPLIISRVSTGDGGFMCKSYPREPILPNKIAVIQFLYDSRRVGPFSKSGYIQTNATNPDLVIKIKGEIIPAPVLSVPKTMNEVGTIQAGDKGKIELTNYGTAPLRISNIEPLNHSVVLKSDRDVVEINETITLEFYPETNANSDVFNYSWNIYSNASEDPKKVSVSGKANYSPLKFDTIDVYLDKSTGITHFFTLNCFNSGDEELEIYRISKDINPERIWFPTGQIYYNEGKKYTIASKENAVLVVAYQLFDYWPRNEKLYIYARSKKSAKEFVSVVRLN